MSMSLRAKLRAKNPATNSETSPSRCRAAIAVTGGRSLERFGQHETPAASGAGPPEVVLVERLGTRKQSEQIDHVVLGLIFDREVLLLERAMQRVLEKLAQIRHRQYARAVSHVRKVSSAQALLSELAYKDTTAICPKVHPRFRRDSVIEVAGSRWQRNRYTANTSTRGGVGSFQGTARPFRLPLGGDRGRMGRLGVRRLRRPAVQFRLPQLHPVLLHLPLNSPEARSATVFWTGALTSILLVGWAAGGLLFGWLADRLGRKRSLFVTITVYAIGTASAPCRPTSGS